MRWEHMLPSDFKKAVRETGLCIVPAASLERHGEHMPFGCDMIITYTLVCKAVEIEPAVIYPPYIILQDHESSCYAGTVNYPQAFAVEAFSRLLKSIAENGFKKILVINGHGGNHALLNYFAMSRIDEPSDYCFYYKNYWMYLEKKENMVVDHAGELETSLFMACCPGLVNLRLAPQEPAMPLKRLDHLSQSGVETGLSWYADYPDNYQFDARSSSEEKGKVIMDLCIRDLAGAIRAVKEDTEAPRLQAEFLQRVRDKGLCR